MPPENQCTGYRRRWALTTLLASSLPSGLMSIVKDIRQENRTHWVCVSGAGGGGSDKNTVMVTFINVTDRHKFKFKFHETPADQVTVTSDDCHLIDFTSVPVVKAEHTMNPQQGRDAFARFAAQLQRQARAGGGGPGRGLLGGGAGLILLVGGGIALNASLFNGM